MDINKLSYFLTNSSSSSSISDSFWNQVQLLMRLDKDTNSRGLPFYRDYSSYQYQVRERIGTSQQGGIRYVENNSEGFPVIPFNNSVNIDSFLVLNNKPNHALRLTELNNSDAISETLPHYLEVVYGANPSLGLGTGDFCIELSFYADEVNLAWANSLQCLFNVGICFTISTFTLGINSIATYLTPASGHSGYGLYLRRNGATTGLFFVAGGQLYQVNNLPITKNTWYHVCVQRTNNNLRTFINGNQTNSYSFNFNLGSDLAPNANTRDNRLTLGTDTRLWQLTGNVLIDNQIIDTSFSGGLSNFRITRATRYAQSLYGLRLPHIILNSQNKIDPLYDQVLFNIPATYDLFEYSNFNNHFTNKLALFNTVVNANTGGIYLDGKNEYTTASLPQTLNGSNGSIEEDWTIEFYLMPFRNRQPDTGFPPNVDILKEISRTATRYSSVYDFLDKNDWDRVYGSSGILDYQTLITLIGDEDKRLLSVRLVYYYNPTFLANRCTYFSLQTSQDGEEWDTFASEDNFDISTSPSNPLTIEGDEIRFGYSGRNTYTNYLSNYNQGFASAFDDPNFHVAICKSDNTLFFFINGALNRTFSFPNEIVNHSSLKLKVGDIFTEVAGSNFNQETQIYETVALGFGIKGIRITNDSRYISNQINDFSFSHSLQPLDSQINKLVPPRARIISLLKRNQLPTVSVPEVEWFVYLSQAVSNLTVNDFTLTQLEGVTGASILSLVRNSDFEYTVRVNTGTGNGKLGLNFIDRNTVRYRDTSILISSFIGELSIEGEQYIINKSRPVPILTSGDSPYVAAPFKVYLTFQGSIQTVDISKIGVVNGTISSFKVLDDVLKRYEFLITPIKQDPVIVQCLEGVGTTDSALISVTSEALVRIFTSQFPILQVPLNIGSTRNDLSPSRLLLDEVITNNTKYNNQIFPIGETSSLLVNPINEESGLKIENFDGISSTFTTYLVTDWTIEFFYRGDSRDRTTHILSVERGNTGFSIVANNGQIQVRRETNGTNNLFIGVPFSEIDTPTYVDWSNNSFSQLQKFPHFAITKKGNVYRFYRNGVRIGLMQSNNIIDITKGILRVGYYENRVNDSPYLLSNVRMTVGRALYSAFQVNVPAIPFPVLRNITEGTSLLSYISIFSNNSFSNKATAGDKINLYFVSIIPLTTNPTVQILGRAADVVVETSNQGFFTENQYKASVSVLETDPDGQVSFNITVASEPGIPLTVFSNTTNETAVFVDNSPLTASITSDSPNDSNHIIEASISFSEDVREFTLEDLTVTNCIVSNLIHKVSTNTYSFDITGRSTGLISVQLESNRVEDLASNGNLSSNVFSRTVTVPTYIPDQYWNNVLLLLEPSASNIVDLSNFSHEIENNNVLVSTNTAPTGLDRAMYFNGINSSLRVELDSTLSSSIDYTIEMFLYIKSNTVFRLARPLPLPASNVSTDSFTANWTPVVDATSYLVDVAQDATFNKFIPGYKNLNIGNQTTIDVNAEALTDSPRLEQSKIVGTKGFVASWKAIGKEEVIGYKLDVAYDTNFVNKLSNYDSRLSLLPYFVVGDIKDAELQSNAGQNSIENGDVGFIPSTAKGVILNGIIGNNTYPKLTYFLEESSVRLYKDMDYSLPALMPDVDTLQWIHLAVVNRDKYTYLYANGELIDKTYTMSFDTDLEIGYDIGHINAYMTGLRISRGIARYQGRSYTVPSLPYGKQ